MKFSTSLFFMVVIWFFGKITCISKETFKILGSRFWRCMQKKKWLATMLTGAHRLELIDWSSLTGAHQLELTDLSSL